MESAGRLSLSNVPSLEEFVFYKATTKSVHGMYGGVSNVFHPRFALSSKLARRAVPCFAGRQAGPYTYVPLAEHVNYAVFSRNYFEYL